MHINAIPLWYEQFQYSIIYTKKSTIAFKENTAFHDKILVALGIPNFV